MYEYLTQRKKQGELKLSSKEMLFSIITNMRIKFYKHTRVNQNVQVIFKLRGNPGREELAHCAILTMPVEEFSHVQ